MNRPSLQFEAPPRWVGIALVVMCLGVLGFVWWNRLSERYADEEDYWRIAGNLVAGNGYALDAPTAFRPPAWPLLLVPFQLLRLELGTASVASALCLIAAAVLAGRLGMLLTRHRLGAIAALLVLGYPINVYTAGTVYPQMLALLAVVVMWWYLARAEGSGWRLPWRSGAALGVAAGVLALSVPTLAFTAVALLVVASVPLWRRGGSVGAVLAAWGSAGLLVGAWVVRNLITFGEFIPLSTSTGINLLLGNNPNATADSGVNADISHILQRVYSMGLSENGRSDALTREALAWITANPGDAVALYLQKMGHYFVAYDAPASAGRGSLLIAAIAWVSFGALVVFAALRWTPWVRKRFPVSFSEWTMLVIFVANAPLMAVFFTRVRFRIPLDAFLCVEAAIGLLAIGLQLLQARAGRSNSGNNT